MKLLQIIILYEILKTENVFSNESFGANPIKKFVSKFTCNFRLLQSTKNVSLFAPNFLYKMSKYNWPFYKFIWLKDSQNEIEKQNS